MKLTKKMCQVIADMEYEIGSECYNPSSYDGWNDVEGCEFRYPINVPDENGDFCKIRGNINRSYPFSDHAVSEDNVTYMKYKFGANELFIGKGLINVLEYLEGRYGIDFNKFEADK